MLSRILLDAALAADDVCSSHYQKPPQRRKTHANLPVPLLHLTSPPPALSLLRPPKSLLSDRVGTGGDMLGQLLPAQVGAGGLFRGVRSTLAARKAPATFPDPHHTRLLLPH